MSIAERAPSAGEGMLAGLIGTAALTGFEPIEQRLLGHLPPYALSPMSRRLRALPPRDALAAARLARWTYGPAWGVVFAWARAPRRERGLARVMSEGAALAAAIWMFEVVALPGLGVVPPIATWPRRDLVGLAAHTLSFGLATSMVLSLRERVQRGRIGSSLTGAP